MRRAWQKETNKSDRRAEEAVRQKNRQKKKDRKKCDERVSNEYECLLNVNQMNLDPARKMIEGKVLSY